MDVNKLFYCDIDDRDAIVHRMGREFDAKLPSWIDMSTPEQVQGGRAYRAGISIDLCPYPKNEYTEMLWLEWRKGWKDAAEKGKKV